MLRDESQWGGCVKLTKAPWIQHVPIHATVPLRKVQKAPWKTNLLMNSSYVLAPTVVKQAVNMFEDTATLVNIKMSGWSCSEA